MQCLSTWSLSAVIAVSAVCCSLIATANAATPTFTKVADTSTVSPDYSAPFTNFNFNPMLSSQTLAIYAQSGGKFGLYSTSSAAPGALAVIADNNTQSPTHNGNLTLPSINPGFSTGRYLLNASDSGGPGIFEVAGGAVTTVAYNGQAAPGGSGTYLGFNPGLRIDSAANVVFAAATSSGGNALFSGQPGSLSVVANSISTPIPNGGGEIFANFNGVAISQGAVAFQADSFTKSGIYTNLGGTLQAVADNGTAVPGGSGNFTTLSAPNMSGSRIVLSGIDSNNAPGLYTWTGGVLSALADTHGGLKLGGIPLAGFGGGNVSLDSKSLAFIASNSSGVGLFSDIGGGGLTNILDTSQPLDGKTLTGLALSKLGLDGNQLAFVAKFNDGSQGIYIATVPEPSAFVIGVAGLAGLVLLRRWRRVLEVAR